jgi:tol-pal system protein YbgF
MPSSHRPTLTRLSLALVGALSACAHEDAGKVSLSELNRTVAALRAQNTAYEKQVQELENRVFILGDQLESRKQSGTSGDAPRPALPSDPALAGLPKVTLHPREKAEPQAEPPGEPAEDVEYAGDAVRSTAKRPVLRLYGDETPVFSRELPVSEERPVARPATPARRLSVASEGGRSERPAPHAVDPGELYHRALEALRAGKHAEAVTGFREFLKLHANHDFADNAQYWLGECFYDQKDYPTAVREFRRVLEKYPQGNKVPDALLKVGFCHLALGSTDVARQTLARLVREFPRHGAATLASAKLAELAGAGAPATASQSSQPSNEEVQ